jgi:opacity protein-like surface antigen
MRKMRRSSNGLRIALLAGASVVALAAAAPSAGAADMNKPMPAKAPAPVPVAKDTWTWWIEGGAFNTSGGSVGFPAFKPKWGGEGAVGFDWQPFAPMHVVGQFRYGAATKSTATQFSFISGPSTINVHENQNLREDHWLVDFGIGRDFGLGDSHAMWTLGIRVADLRSKLNINSNISTVGPTPSPTTIAAQERSTFVGAGPRFGLQGDVPLGGQWGLDWQAGAAVLFGERTLTITTNTPFAGSQTDTPTIFNVDAQAGLSYWLNPNMKFTVGYRYDEYFRALKTLNVTNATSLAGPTVAVTNIDRAYSGPMVRLTTKF